MESNTRQFMRYVKKKNYLGILDEINKVNKSTMFLPLKKNYPELYNDVYNSIEEYSVGDLKELLKSSLRLIVDALTNRYDSFTFGDRHSNINTILKTVSINIFGFSLEFKEPSEIVLNRLENKINKICNKGNKGLINYMAKALAFEIDNNRKSYYDEPWRTSDIIEYILCNLDKELKELILIRLEYSGFIKGYTIDKLKEYFRSKGIDLIRMFELHTIYTLLDIITPNYNEIMNNRQEINNYWPFIDKPIIEILLEKLPDYILSLNTINKIQLLGLPETYKNIPILEVIDITVIYYVLDKIVNYSGKKVDTK